MYSAIWAYPWDMIDEGADAALGRIAEAGLDGVSVAAAYHTVRTLCPHNPRRAVFHGEGGVLYFRPDPACFNDTRICPVMSELAAHTDPLVDVCSAAARADLRVHAWTVLTHNTRLGTAYPDCVCVNAFGDPYPFGLCPANPDVRAYVTAMVRALAQVEGLHSIELESLGYMGIDHTGHHSKAGVELDAAHRYLLSLCFCPHCARRMRDHGVDAEQAAEAVRREMRAYLAGQLGSIEDDPPRVVEDILGEDVADGIIAARDKAVLTLLEDLYWLVREKQELCLTVTGDPLATGAGAAVSLPTARQWCDRMLVQTAMRDPEQIHAAVADVCVHRGSKPVTGGLQAIAPFVRSAAELQVRVDAIREAGAEGIQFYHYGLMPLANLDWISQALR